MGTYNTNNSLDKIVNSLHLDISTKATQIAEIGRPIISYLISLLSDSGNKLFVLSYRTLYLLENYSDVIAPQLLKLLHKRDQTVRLYAARILVKYGESVIHHIQKEYSSSNSTQKLRLLRILDTIGSIKAIEILENALLDEKEEIQQRATNALLRLGYLGTKSLIKSLETNPSLYFSDPKIVTMIRGGRATGLHIITIIKNSEISYETRYKAALILGKIIDFASIKDLYEENEEIEIKKLALVALEYCPDNKKIILFRKGLSSSENQKTEESSQTDITLGEQALFSLHHAILLYFNHNTPMRLTDRDITNIASFYSSNSFKVRHACFSILIYISTHHAKHILKTIIKEAIAPIKTFFEIIIAAFAVLRRKLLYQTPYPLNHFYILEQEYNKAFYDKD